MKTTGLVHWYRQLFSYYSTLKKYTHLEIISSNRFLPFKHTYKVTQSASLNSFVAMGEQTDRFLYLQNTWNLPAGMWLKLEFPLVGGSTTTWGTWSPENPGASWRNYCMRQNRRDEFCKDAKLQYKVRHQVFYHYRLIYLWYKLKSRDLYIPLTFEHVNWFYIPLISQ